MRRILVSSLLLTLLIAAGAIVAQPPKSYLVKLAAADDAWREGFVLSEKDTLDENRKALALFLKAITLYKGIRDKDGEGKSLLYASKTADALGDKKAAVYYGIMALGFFKEPRNRAWEGELWNHLGQLYTSLGLGEAGIHFYFFSLKAYRELDDFDGSIPVLNNIGRYYEETGDYEKALENYNLTLEYIEGAKLDPRLSEESTRGMVLANIAGVYLKQGRTRESLELYEQALDLQRKAGLPRAEMRTLNNIGTLYFKTGDTVKALEYFYKTLPLDRLVGDRSSEATTLSNLMNAHRKQGNRREAIFFGKQTINRYQEMRRNINGIGKNYRKSFLTTVEDSYRVLADILIEAGLFAQAEQVLRMLKEEEFFEFVGRDADEIKSLGERLTLTPMEQELVERYTALAGRITAIGAGFQKLEARKTLLKKSNQELSPAEQAEYQKFSAQLADANAAFKLFLDTELAKELGAENVRSVESNRELQAKVGIWEKGTVMLHTVLLENRYRVILTTANAQVDGKTEIGIAELNKKIFAFRAALRDRTVDPRPLGKELYDLLVKPIEQDLKAAEANTLVWSLDGALRYIPFAALSPDGKTYMAEKYRNVTITARTRDGIADRGTNWRVLGVGMSAAISVTDPQDSNFMISFKALPAARTELMKIVRDGNGPGEIGIFGGKRLMNKEFTVQAFSDSLAGVGGRKFNAVHMASHFRLGDNRLSSFLLLGDGNILSLEDISKSPKIDFGGVELVTLSACNTAFGTSSTGKEVDSLADIIQTKNGNAILATLWSVSDESTSLLMGDFYKTRKEVPAGGKAGAIQAAQKAMIHGQLKTAPGRAMHNPGRTTAPENSGLPKFVFDPAKPFAHPYYWSPFVLIGNWR